VYELDQLGLVAAAFISSDSNGAGDDAPVLVMGDFNADCSYLGKTAWTCIREASCTSTSMALYDGTTFSAENWLIGDDADTTVAVSSCAYDRIVASTGLLPRVVSGSITVHAFDVLFNISIDEARNVSDHFPVSINIDVRTDTSAGPLLFATPVFEGQTTPAEKADPSVLRPGDVAVIGLHSDNLPVNGDFFSFVLLVEVGAGTQIRFTDNGWSCTDNAFLTGEGVVMWTASVDYAAGTVIESTKPLRDSGEEWIKVSRFIALSTTGDPLYAYLGTDLEPQFLYAVSAEGVKWSEAVSTATGCLPATLPANASFHLGEHRDNFFFAGTRTGTFSVAPPPPPY
jgi:hypothetical protein